MADIDSVILSRAGKPEALIEVLQDIQGIYRYLPEEVLWKVSEILEVPVIEVFRVANIYKAFRLKPQGKHLVNICTGTACHVRGASRLLDEMRG